VNRLLIENQQPATLESVRELRHLLEQVTLMRVPQSFIKKRMLLCLSEAATNLIQHASTRLSQITMRFGKNNTGWWLEILDDGNALDPANAVLPNSLDKFSESESDRGLSLLNSLCDHFEYQAASSGNELNRLRLLWNSPAQNTRPHILLVEDDNSLRKLYELYLAETLEVTTAASGQEALLKLETEQIDLVLSDICMPQMDGIALREQLITDSNSRLIPFIFLTAMGDTAHVEKATSLGIDDYLTKPIKKEQLIITIQRVLKRSEQVYQQLTDRIDEGITSSLAPSVPKMNNNWNLGIANRHTGSGGGDLLLHRSGKDFMQIMLTDIMGHDDCAKFFAHACGGYLRGLMNAATSDRNPAKLLDQMSDFCLQDQLMSKITLTSCSAVLSNNGEITLACAGHPPPLLITPKGISKLQVSGILPGLIPDTNYQSTTFKVAADERIVLYTDGLFESAADEKLRQQLEQRITSELVNTLNDPIEQALEKIMAVFDELGGSPPKDDVLLLLMAPV